MTKKHFIAFALEVKEGGHPIDVRLAMARMVARVAVQDNPRFDRARFMKACGLED